MPRAYIVTESTPGYLPDSEPATFSNRHAAERYAAGLARELYEDRMEIFQQTRDPDDRPRRSGSAAAGRIDVDTGRPHDLGRVITVDTLTGDDAAEALAEQED